MQLDDRVRPCALRTDDDSGLVSSALPTPRLSWRLSAERDGVRQVGYQLEIANDPQFAVESCRSRNLEGASPLFVPWPFEPLVSRQRRWWRVRVRTERGWTPWSEGRAIEGSLYERSDWIARPISPHGNVGRTERSPSCLLRREFTITELASARLYTTALGIHRLFVNGHAVGDALLEPGWTDHRHRTLFASYDVTDLLVEGPNCLAAELADGWWRGELGWLGRRGIYGKTTALLTQLELIDDRGEMSILATDAGWRGGYGAVRMAELYDGVDADLRLEPSGWQEAGFDDSSWEEVIVLDLPPGLEQRSMPPVRALATFPPLSVTSTATTISVDTGRNLAGILKLHASGPRGAQVSVRHAEVLDSDGRPYVAPLRNARAMDTYILKGEGNEALYPPFTFHGFRYAEIEVDPGAEISAVEVVQLGSGLEYSGDFRCSNPDLDALFANAVASQKANFLALPTDCPQRDERLGWTGDIQVFCETACFNADARSFLANWLRDLASEQRPDGNVPSTVPNIIEGHEFEFGGVGWSDAAVLVPWTLYAMYGDQGVLERQYPSMKAWVDYASSRLDRDGLWTGDFHLGDWLDPGAPADKPHLATTDRDFIATSYLAHSARCVAAAAKVLGADGDQAFYESLSQRTADAAWQRWQDQAVLTQTGCAMAIMFDIAPANSRAEVGKRLASLVVSNGGRIATGFLGTPLVLPALSQTGQTDAAYRLLLNRACPGWLYQVDLGATSMWERWDALRPDGSPQSGAMSTGEASSMISFNHYAYGSVAAWLYQTVAGISYDPRHPGFARVRFAPEPGGGLTWAAADLVTGFGKASIRWELNASDLVIEMTVPPGAVGTLSCPPGYYPPSRQAVVELESGRHCLELRRNG